MNLLPALRAALATGRPAILVTVAQALGSTPREAGAAMLVTPDGTVGTVGGGALELEAILEARRMIGDGTARAELDIPLGPAIGQCCGGRVLLVLERVEAATLDRLEHEACEAERQQPAVFVFGAGHTGQALARALALLPFRLTVVDTRPHFLAELPPVIARIATPVPEEIVAAAGPGSAFVVMTHDHALDFLIAARALARGDAAYVGMIGSVTKREKFRRFLRDDEAGFDDARLVLPLGGTAVRDKRPAVIAALTAAEILRFFTALDKGCTGFAPAGSGCNNIGRGEDRPSKRLRDGD